MPENSLPLHKLLSNRQYLRYQELVQSLDWWEAGQFHLAILGLDSERLAEALRVDLSEHIPRYCYYVLERVFRMEFQTILQKAKKAKILILQLSVEDSEVDQHLAAELLFHRDELIRKGINLILLLPISLYDQIQETAYDFLSVATFAERFYDQAAGIEKDLTKSREAVPAKLDYEQALAAYQKNLAQSAKPRLSLLTKTFFLAQKAYAISLLDESLKYYKVALTLARKLANQDYLSATLGSIGLIYRAKGELDEASQYHQEALQIARKIGSLQGEANQLGNIGLICYDKGESDAALKYHQEALALHRQIGYLEGEANQLGNIGLIYKAKGKPDEALKYHQEALQIDHQIGSLQGEANQLGNIGVIYSAKGELDEALKYIKEALALHRQIGSLQGEANQLGNIGLIYRAKGDPGEAMQYFHAAKEAFEALGLASKVTEYQSLIEKMEVEVKA